MEGVVRGSPHLQSHLTVEGAESLHNQSLHLRWGFRNFPSLSIPPAARWTDPHTMCSGGSYSEILRKQCSSCNRSMRTTQLVCASGLQIRIPAHAHKFLAQANV